jgi:2-polyprenyl-3-methyl-5-hydroxy-6-metoxy-1,4-benzoquinol methylase
MRIMTSTEDALTEMQRRGQIVEDIIRRQKPDLLDIYYTYQNEAVEARKFIQESLSHLKPESEILEVGGGILALSIQLSAEGYRVTTVEPIGDGFGDIAYILKIFLNVAKKEAREIKFLGLPIEEYSFEEQFDFAFSINVMEHLNDPYEVLIRLVKSLKPGGTYQFFCPNYDFPYEPHFGKILFSRRNQAFYLNPTVIANPNVMNRELIGLYNSLNFITIRKISKTIESQNVLASYNKQIFFQLALRALHDRFLIDRHPLLHRTLKLANMFRLMTILKFWPLHFQPIMDVKIIKLVKQHLDGSDLSRF